MNKIEKIFFNNNDIDTFPTVKDRRGNFKKMYKK